MMKTVKEETRKGPWTEQEDLQLASFVRAFGQRRWDFIAKVSGLSRTGKSCRLRWVNYLHPGLKRGRMTPQEEQTVLEFQAQWGNRWSRIARKLPGRTDNEIKNYWRTHMRKKAQEKIGRSSPSPSPSPSTSTSILSMNKCVTKEVNEKEDAKGYSMDEIWKEIAPLGEINSVWYHCSELLWGVNDDEVNKP